jgi:hypothetical protein
VAGREHGVAKQRVEGSLSTRGACYARVYTKISEILAVAQENPLSFMVVTRLINSKKLGLATFRFQEVRYIEHLQK